MRPLRCIRDSREISPVENLLPATADLRRDFQLIFREFNAAMNSFHVAGGEHETSMNRVFAIVGIKIIRIASKRRVLQLISFEIKRTIVRRKKRRITKLVSVSSFLANNPNKMHFCTLYLNKCNEELFHIQRRA